MVVGHSEQPQCCTMSCSAVADMRFKAVTRKLDGQFFHVLIPRNLGDDAGRTNCGHSIIGSNEGATFRIIGQEVQIAIDDDLVIWLGNLLNSTLHCKSDCLSEAEFVDFCGRHPADPEINCFYFDLSS